MQHAGLRAGEIKTLARPRHRDVHQTPFLLQPILALIDRIFVRSASYPNWLALPIAVQGDIIPDFPLINKSFELCYACLDR